ncbi:MAG: succinyldiaminopimelate transaminase [Mycobacteriaceae bacterium]
MPGRSRLSLPTFPWDALAGASATARAHPDGIVDLSVGTPVDPVAPLLQHGLAQTADVSGYPAVWGTAQLRQSAVDALARRHSITGLDPDAVLPTIGSKELIAWLPTLLGLGRDDTVVVPELAYPTYEVGARLVGAKVVRFDPATPVRPALVYVNSPANPTGAVLDVGALRTVVDWSRDRGAVVVSDECYLGLGWEAEPVSVLHPEVNGGHLDGLLAVHSLSKSSSLAGYRAGFVTGDPALVAELLEVRRHMGMIVPRPVQSAMTVALRDDDHVAAQRERYAARRRVLLTAVRAAGLRVDRSEAGLYLWASRDEPCQDTVSWFAQRGILVAPGQFYGPAGARHVRIALTATDERVAAAVSRLQP